MNLIYESRVAFTVYEFEYKNGGMNKHVSSKDFQYDSSEPAVERYATPDEAVEKFLEEHKGWTFACKEGKDGCNLLEAVSPLMTCTAFNESPEFLKESTYNQVRKFENGEIVQYKVKAVLEVYQVSEKLYNLEEYFSEFRG